jgi:hypothetical protein
VKTAQILAQIIYEAVLFWKIVPSRIKTDINELEKVIEYYGLMKERLGTMAAIIHS